MRRVYASIAVIAVALTLVFLLPIVPERVSSCFPLSDCPLPSFHQVQVSVTYKVFSVGGLFDGSHYTVAYLPGYTCQTSGYQTVTAIGRVGNSTTSTMTFYTVPITTCSPNVIVIRDVH